MAQRAGYPGQPPGGGVGVPGDATERVGDRDLPPALVVGGPQLSAIGAAPRRGPAQLVVLELGRGVPVVDSGDPAKLVDGVAAAPPRRVDAGGEVALGVVLAQPARAGWVVDPDQAA